MKKNVIYLWVLSLVLFLSVSFQDTAQARARLCKKVLTPTRSEINASRLKPSIRDSARALEVLSFYYKTAGQQKQIIKNLSDADLRQFITDSLELRTGSFKYNNYFYKPEGQSGGRKGLLPEIYTLTKIKDKWDTYLLGDAIGKILAFQKDSYWSTDLRARDILIETVHQFKYQYPQQVYAKTVNEVLDMAFGLDWHSAELAIEKREDGQISHFNIPKGTPQWSWANPRYGWLTDYQDLFVLLRRLKVQSGQTLIDIGSAHGRSGLVAGYVEPGLKFIGYEIVPERVEEARRVTAVNGYKNVKYELEDVSAPAFKLPAADFYFLYDALNAETMQKILAKLIKNGKKKDFILAIRFGSGLNQSLASSNKQLERFDEIHTPEVGESITFYRMRRD